MDQTRPPTPVAMLDNPPLAVALVAVVGGFVGLLTLAGISGAATPPASAPVASLWVLGLAGLGAALMFALSPATHIVVDPGAGLVRITRSWGPFKRSQALPLDGLATDIETTVAEDGSQWHRPILRSGAMRVPMAAVAVPDRAAAEAMTTTIRAAIRPR